MNHRKSQRETTQNHEAARCVAQKIQDFVWIERQQHQRRKLDNHIGDTIGRSTTAKEHRYSKQPQKLPL
ncbi:hypothetical protein LK12_19325 [Novosphingobium malaysiense]|uniref:Uncharacterized protein n=1 Tax=Novosphingobium malaysiense TaxID=1348853 RepID=A0A0B1ZG13_9SPHN|nr:hypothetical protein LK12_19325 [Novosphingobium malaysiense]